MRHVKLFICRKWNYNILIFLIKCSSHFQIFIYSLKNSRETLLNYHIFGIVFRFSFRANFGFVTADALVYVDTFTIFQRCSRWKMKRNIVILYVTFWTQFGAMLTLTIRLWFWCIQMCTYVKYIHFHFPHRSERDANLEREIDIGCCVLCFLYWKFQFWIQKARPRTDTGKQFIF